MRRIAAALGVDVADVDEFREEDEPPAQADHRERPGHQVRHAPRRRGRAAGPPGGGLIRGRPTAAGGMRAAPLTLLLRPLGRRLAGRGLAGATAIWRRMARGAGARTRPGGPPRCSG